MLSIDDKSIISCLAFISISLIVYIYTRAVKTDEKKIDEIKENNDLTNKKLRELEIKIVEIQANIRHNSVTKSFSDILTRNMINDFKNSNPDLLNSVIDKTSKNFEHEK